MADFVKSTWKKKALNFKGSQSASWDDHLAIKLEIENIAKFIKPGQTVLDAGCSNGYSTIEQFRKKRIDITGIDFTPQMIRLAKKRLKENKISKGIKFETGDVKKLRFPDNTFDITYTTRVLINLNNWEEQKEGISECIRVTRKGGTVIFSESFWEPLVQLNSLRSLMNMQPLVEHDFNRYLKESRMKDYLVTLGYRPKVLDFCSVYYIGSRFLRELFTDADKYTGYSNPINEVFYNLEKEYSCRGFGIQKAYMIKK